MRQAPSPPVRKERVRVGDYEFHVLGAPRAGLRDFYHWLLRIPWWATVATIVGGYLGLNVLFALLYLVAGGVNNMRSGSFGDAFFFSVQTMGTIGYGSMYPTTVLSHSVMVIESVAGILATALATGLVFVRFSQTRARMVFSARVAIGPVDGRPTVMVRLGNERRSQIMDARFRMMITRTTHTREGVLVYRTEDLHLVRHHAPALARSWMIQHRIEEGSPLFGETPKSLADSEAEIVVTVVGVDDTALQQVHARHTWFVRDIVWGARLADVLSETEGGSVITLDLRRFHDLTPTDPIDGFPYRGESIGGPPPM